MFEDVDDPSFTTLPDLIKNRCLRLRSLYTEANDFPMRKDSVLISSLMKKFKSLSRTQAYEDLRIVKTILGDVHEASKEYHRWRAIQWIEDTYRAAVAAGDNNARVKAIDIYGKLTKLNVEDEAIIDWSRIPKQPFTITMDPTNLGLKPIPDIRKYIDNTIAEFSKDDIVDVDFEEIDTNYDPFQYRKEDGGATVTD